MVASLPRLSQSLPLYCQGFRIFSIPALRLNQARRSHATP